MKNIILILGEINWKSSDKEVSGKKFLAKISSDDVRGEYRLFKRMVRSNHKNTKNGDLWIIIMNNDYENTYIPTYISLE